MTPDLVFRAFLERQKLITFDGKDFYLGLLFYQWVCQKVRISINPCMSNQPIIAIGDRGTSIPGNASLVRRPLTFGINPEPWRSKRSTPEADEVHGWVSRKTSRFELLLLKDALKKGMVKAVLGARWSPRYGKPGDPPIHQGTAYFKATWTSNMPQPQYVAVESNTWKHGRIESKRVSDGRNEDVVADLDFSSLLSAPTATVPSLVPFALGGEFYDEGKSCQIIGNRRERDPRARRSCIEEKGVTCTVCGFNFGEVYGEIGEGFTHVHHENPLTTGERQTNPSADLWPICPNCHAMIHRKRTPISIRDLKRAVKSRVSA